MKPEIENIETEYRVWESLLGLNPGIFPLFCDHKELMIDCTRCEPQHPAVLIGRIQEQVSSLSDSRTRDRIMELLTDLQRALLERDLETSLRYIERQQADEDSRFVEERCSL